MKKRLNLLLTLSIASLLLFGCSNQKKTEEQQSTKESKVNLSIKNDEKNAEKLEVQWPYYEIKKDGEVKGYLLGTVHGGNKEMYPFPEKMIENFNSSGKLITELGENMEASESKEEIAGAMMTEEPITQGMSDEAKERYVEVLQSYDLSEDDVASLNRYGVYMILFSMANSDSSETNTFEEKGKYGVESQLKLLKENHKDIQEIGLETTAIQTKALIESQDKPSDINEWVKTLMTKEENMKSSSGLQAIDEYVNGENDVSDQHPEQLEIINYARNATWVETLPEYLNAPEKCFIAVGNAHLPGEKGVIEGLKQKGYDVTKVTF